MVCDSGSYFVDNFIVFFICFLFTDFSYFEFVDRIPDSTQFDNNVCGLGYAFGIDEFTIKTDKLDEQYILNDDETKQYLVSDGKCNRESFFVLYVRLTLPHTHR